MHSSTWPRFMLLGKNKAAWAYDWLSAIWWPCQCRTLTPVGAGIDADFGQCILTMAAKRCIRHIYGKLMLLFSDHASQDKPFTTVTDSPGWCYVVDAFISRWKPQSPLCVIIIWTNRLHVGGFWSSLKPYLPWRAIVVGEIYIYIKLYLFFFLFQQSFLKRVVTEQGIQCIVICQ